NVIDHFYVGGRRLADLRGLDLPSIRRPEEWVAATVHRADDAGVGPSRLADGALFAEVVAADHEGWTGSSVGAPGAGPADTGLLVKLLDAGQRLPVHVHPTRAFASDHLHSCYGKTEAWYVIDVEGDDPAVWVGWRADVDPNELASRVDAQDSDWMLDRMSKITVRPGDGIVVPAGEPHATGAGVFVVEVQEPTDFSILLEWSVTTATREESHLDLGFDVALRAVDHRAISAAELAGLQQHVEPGQRSDALLSALPAPADPYFRIDVAAPSTGEVTIDAGFAVLLVVDGRGELGRGTPTTVDRVPIERGQAWAVPAGLGAWTVSGEVRAIVCRPSATWPHVA
ncbi:MAG TPA: class I mannose-6-phosphate isomerase, partial [Microlunatus sp.]|nr:class I mannose-6-phosphate isomerase [Microlunatus sp.]